MVKKFQLTGQMVFTPSETSISRRILVVATATDASGKNATKQLIVSPSTANGVIKPSDSSRTITNKFDTTGITTDKEPPYVVKNAGVEFNKVNDDGTISLTGTSWTRLAGGWAKDKAFPLGAHMILNFQNPTFYEHIEVITIKPTYQGKEKTFTSYENGSVWSVPIENDTVKLLVVLGQLMITQSQLP